MHDEDRRDQVERVETAAGETPERMMQPPDTVQARVGSAGIKHMTATEVNDRMKEAKQEAIRFIAREVLDRMTEGEALILLRLELRSRFIRGLAIGFLAGWGLFFILWVWILDSPRLF